MADLIDINHLKKLQQEFSSIREWEKFHSPKNLSMALACEASEILGIFQWSTEEESREAYKNTELKEKISHELADIILNVVRIADLLKINLNEAVSNKMVRNNLKYPAKKAKGLPKKYDEYFTD